MEKLGKLASIAAVCAIVGIVIYFSGGRVWTTDGINDKQLVSDSYIFYEAANNIKHGKTPYPNLQEEGSNFPGSLYCYLPTVALMLAPFSDMSIMAKTLIWYGIITLAFLISYFYIYKIADILDLLIAKGWRFPAITGIALLLFEPIQNNYIHAQSNSVQLLFIITFIWAFIADKKNLAGILLGIGITIKFLPLIFGLFLLYRREWRVIIVTAVSFLIVLLLPALYIDLGTLYNSFFVTFTARSSHNYMFLEFFMTLYRSIIWLFPALAGVYVKVIAILAICAMLVGGDYYLSLRAKGNELAEKITAGWMLLIYSTTILLIHPHSEVHIVVYAFPAFVMTALFALKSGKVSQIVIWGLIYAIYVPLLWAQETPITFISLVLLNSYSFYCAWLQICKQNTVQLKKIMKK